MTKMLTGKDKEAIAALVSHPGYLLLTEAIQAEVDDLSDRLQESDSFTKDRRLLNIWRGLRQVLEILKIKPQEIMQEVDLEKQEIESLFEVKDKWGYKTQEELEKQLDEFLPQLPKDLEG